MKKYNRWFWLVIALIIVMGLLGILFLFGMENINVDLPASVSEQGRILNGPKKVFQAVNSASKLLIVAAILAIVLGFFVAMFLFPPLAVIIIIISVIRYKKVKWYFLCFPVFLVFASVAAWNLSILLTNGSDYYFNHDFGSNVYNEGYIIPYYEDLYEEELTMIEKNVMDPNKTVFTFRSGKTGEVFTVKSENYSIGAGSFDRLHLSDTYSDILSLRLNSGEKIRLPYDEYFYITHESGQGGSLCIRKSEGKFEVKFGSEREEVLMRPWRKEYLVSIEDGILKVEIQVGRDEVSVHCFDMLGQ